MSRPVSPSENPFRPALRGVAVFCAALVWLLGLLAASPELHERLHHDAEQSGHSCAVTLFNHGLENPLAATVLQVAPSLAVVGEIAATEPRQVESVEDWLPPGRGPPVS